MRQHRTRLFFFLAVPTALTSMLASCAKIYDLQEATVERDAGEDVQVVPEDVVDAQAAPTDVRTRPDVGDACVGEGCACEASAQCFDSLHKTCVDGKCRECSVIDPTTCAKEGTFCAPTDASRNAGGCIQGCTADRHCIAATSSHCITARHQCVECLNQNECEVVGTGCSPANACAKKCNGTPNSCDGVPNTVCCGGANGYCVDLKTDHENCNECGKRCSPDEICCASKCVKSVSDTSSCPR